MKKFVSLLCAACLLGTLFSVCFVLPVSAAEYDASSWDEIREYVAQAGEETVITLNNSVIVGEPITIDHPCTVTIKKGGPLNTFFGNGDRAFVIDSAGVKLIFEDIMFSAFRSDCKGGVIYISENADCTISGGYFDICEQPEDGAAIYANGKCTIKHAKFEKCIVYDDYDGGAVYLNAAGCVIDNCTFIDCYAETNGGAVFVNKDDCMIQDCTFTGCHSAHDGGAVYLGVSVDECCISECTFEICYSHKGDGGAIALGNWCDDDKISDCTFRDCTAVEKGHWVYGDGDDTIVEGCTAATSDNCYVKCKVQNPKTGFILSEGNLWILLVVLAVGATVLVIVKKEKKAEK